MKNEGGLQILLNELQAYHKVELSHQALSDYLWTLQPYELPDLEKAFAAWRYEQGPTSRFPSPAQLISLVLQVREAEWQKQKKATPTWEVWKQTAKSIPHHFGQELATETIALTDQLGIISISEYIEKMRDMEDKFPGIGWEHETDKLEKWFSVPAATRYRGFDSDEYLQRIETLRRKNLSD